jgi:hypothetical protein
MTSKKENKEEKIDVDKERKRIKRKSKQKI